MARLVHLYNHDSHWRLICRSGDYAKRAEEIENTKPAKEVPTMLKFFRLIPDELVPGLDSPEWLAYVKAVDAYDKVWLGVPSSRCWVPVRRLNAMAAHDKARDAYLVKYRAELETLHTKLFPDCPWDEAKQTMFPKKEIENGYSY